MKSKTAIKTDFCIKALKLQQGKPSLQQLPRCNVNVGGAMKLNLSSQLVHHLKLHSLSQPFEPLTYKLTSEVQSLAQRLKSRTKCKQHILGPRAKQ